MMLALRSIGRNEKRYYDFYWYDDKPANTYFDKKIHELLYFNMFTKYVARALKYFPYGVEHSDIFISSRDKDCIFYRTKDIKSSYINFDKDENEAGTSYLSKYGVKQGDKVVCLLVRDPAYLDSTTQCIDYSYHDYRDSDIDSYSLMVGELVKRGYWVIRMGKIVTKEFAYKNDKVIDYACSHDRSDFLDIWLMANCFFCVTTGSGLDKVCQAYRVPQVFVNTLPLNLFASYDHSIWASKRLYWKGTNKLLTLKEYLDNSFQSSRQYHDHSVDIVNMSDIEIKDTVVEMEERLTGNWISTKEDEMLQAEFQKIFKQHKDYKKFHNQMHPEARYSTSFLRKHHDWVM